MCEVKEIKIKNFYTHNEYHIGDNLWHLNFMRRLAQKYQNYKFFHAAKEIYHTQLNEVISDISNLFLINLDSRPLNSLNVWLNYNNFHDHHPNKFEISLCLIDHFNNISKKLNLECPVVNTSDLLFDYPEIKRVNFPKFDFLIINSMPESNQFKEVPSDFDKLIAQLISKKYSIITTEQSSFPCPCTRNLGYSITDIGAISLSCKFIIGVPNGPMWPTFNKWNINSVKFRILTISNGDKVNFCSNTYHVESIDESINLLRSFELL